MRSIYIMGDAPDRYDTNNNSDDARLFNTQLTNKRSVEATAVGLFH